MKYLIILLFLSFSVKAQNVFITQFQNQANVSVFVTNFQSEADLNVCLSSFPTYGQNEGRWHIVGFQSESNTRVFFTNNRNQADIIIFYTEFISQAGWRSSNKIGLIK